MSDLVLLLDGDDRDAELLERSLGARGWRVVRTRDFTSAILAFESARPSVAVIAVDQLEGGRFLTALRGREDAARFPVVLIDSPRPSPGAPETRRSQAPIRPEDIVLLRPLLIEDIGDRLQRFRALDSDELRAIQAAEEAVRAAYDESFEREERLHRWTRQREEERQQLDAAQLPGIDFAEALITAASAIDPAMQVELQSLPAETEADQRFTRALATGSTLQAAAEKSDLSLERARAIVALGMLEEGVAPTDRSPPARETIDLARWLAEHKDRDYFAILGLTRAASPDACRAALVERATALNLADRVGDPLANEVLRLLEEAHAVVSSPVLSTAYRNHLEQ